jgi:hypothetical protein
MLLQSVAIRPRGREPVFRARLGTSLIVIAFAAAVAVATLVVPGAPGMPMVAAAAGAGAPRVTDGALEKIEHIVIRT